MNVTAAQTLLEVHLWAASHRVWGSPKPALKPGCWYTFITSPLQEQLAMHLLQLVQPPQLLYTPACICCPCDTVLRWGHIPSRATPEWHVLHNMTQHKHMPACRPQCA